MSRCRRPASPLPPRKYLFPRLPSLTSFSCGLISETPILISETPMLISRFNPLKGDLYAKGYWCGLALVPVYFFGSPYPLPPGACCGSAGGSCGVLLPSLVFVHVLAHTAALQLVLLLRPRVPDLVCMISLCLSAGGLLPCLIW